MFGSDIGSLKVYATSSSRQSRHLIWQKMGNQGDTWHQGSIPVPVSAVGYLVSILIANICCRIKTFTVKVILVAEAQY